MKSPTDTVKLAITSILSLQISLVPEVKKLPLWCDKYDVELQNYGLMTFLLGPTGSNSKEFPEGNKPSGRMRNFGVSYLQNRVLRKLRTRNLTQRYTEFF